MNWPRIIFLLLFGWGRLLFMAVTLLLGLGIELFNLVKPIPMHIAPFQIICGGKTIELTSVLIFLLFLQYKNEREIQSGSFSFLVQYSFSFYATKLFQI